MGKGRFGRKRQGSVYAGQTADVDPALTTFDLLRALGWLVRHDVPWPGKQLAVIDHLLVGPPGVFVVVDDPDATEVDPAAPAGWQAEADRALEAATDVAAALPGVPVTPVVCFREPEPFTAVAGSVFLCTLGNVVEVLSRAPERINEVILGAVRLEVNAGLHLPNSEAANAHDLPRYNVLPAEEPEDEVEEQPEEYDEAPADVEAVAVVDEPGLAPESEPEPSAEQSVEESAEESAEESVEPSVEPEPEPEREPEPEAEAEVGPEADQDRDAEWLVAQQAEADAVEAARAAAQQAEDERLAVERAAAEEAARQQEARLAEESARQEQARRAAEEAARQEEARLEAEESARQERARLAAEEASRQEADWLAAEQAEAQSIQAARMAADTEESRRLEEAARADAAAEEARAAEERAAVEQAAVEQAAVEQAREAEQQRLAAEEAARHERLREDDQAEVPVVQPLEPEVREPAPPESATSGSAAAEPEPKQKRDWPMPRGKGLVAVALVAALALGALALQGPLGDLVGRTKDLFTDRAPARFAEQVNVSETLYHPGLRLRAGVPARVPGRNQVRVAFNVHNSGDQPWVLVLSRVTLVDGAGISHPARARGQLPQGRVIGARTRVAASGSAGGFLLFDLPRDEKVKELRLELGPPDGDDSDDTVVWFNRAS